VDGGTRREQAVELRLAGFSRSQIADAMGLATTGGVLSRWLKDVPAPDWTQRPNAKDDVRAQAVAMRREGRSYREIRDVLGVSKSSLSLWLRDVPLTEEQQRALALRVPAATSARAQGIRATAARRRSTIRAQARAQVPDLSESELFVAGVVAYWAEGTKNKPWRRSEAVKFMNSDPALIRVFLAWLRLLGVSPDSLVFGVHIHESADAQAAVAFWSGVVGAPESRFRKCTMKRHNPRTVRKNVGADYHGCLLVYVRNSTVLNLQIEGWCQGIAAAAEALDAG